MATLKLGSMPTPVQMAVLDEELWREYKRDLIAYAWDQDEYGDEGNDDYFMEEYLMKHVPVMHADGSVTAHGCRHFEGEVHVDSLPIFGVRSSTATFAKNRVKQQFLRAVNDTVVEFNQEVEKKLSA